MLFILIIRASLASLIQNLVNARECLTSLSFITYPYGGQLLAFEHIVGSYVSYSIQSPSPALFYKLQVRVLLSHAHITKDKSS